MAAAGTAATRRGGAAARAARAPRNAAAAAAPLLILALALLARGAAAVAYECTCTVDSADDFYAFCDIGEFQVGDTLTTTTLVDWPTGDPPSYWTVTAPYQSPATLEATTQDVSLVFPSIRSEAIATEMDGSAGPIPMAGADDAFLSGSGTQTSALSTQAGTLGQTVFCTFYYDAQIKNPGDPAQLGFYSIRIIVDCYVNPAQSEGIDDPHLRGFFGHKYEFCGPQLAGQCQGRAFSLLSHRHTLLNTLVSRHTGPDAWPYAGTWMTAFGFRYRSILSLELGLATDVHYAIEGTPGGGGGSTRALPVAGGFRALLAFARVNGEDVLADLVESGHTLELGGAAKGEGRTTVHFPVSKHAHDAASGPVAVITTPDFKITMLLEAGDIYHLNFQITIISGDIKPLHGLLGQSIAWAGRTASAVEGDDLDYAVNGGLLGSAFRFSAWGKRAERAASNLRATLSTARRPAFNGLTARGQGRPRGRLVKQGARAWPTHTHTTTQHRGHQHRSQCNTARWSGAGAANPVNPGQTDLLLLAAVLGPARARPLGLPLAGWLFAALILHC
ncbi:MAG: hypothetical protein J3K34DRAFT_102910 [Monoraphidium minutum]|nr:MAG: hypothetical protein J3K34DRAFT_102910 [Monoraphidium minutum]